MNAPIQKQPERPGLGFAVTPVLLHSRQSLVLLLSCEGIVVDLNQPMADLLGRPLESLKGTSLSPHLPAEGREGYQAIVQRVAREREPCRHEIQFDRSGRWYDACLAPNVDARGEVNGVVMIAWDVTDRKQTGEALQRSAHASKRLRQSIIAINACQDLDSALACLLRKAIDLGGMDSGAVYLIDGQEAVLQHQVGLDPAFVRQVARRPLAMPHIQAMLAAPQTMLNAVQRFPDQALVGQTYGLRHVHATVLVADQKPFGLLFVVSHVAELPSPADIELTGILAMETESVFLRLRAGQRLQQLINEQRVILNTAPQGIAHIRDHRVVWANRGQETLFGFPPGCIVGTAPEAHFADPEEYRRLTQDALAQFAGGAVYSTETELKRNDGTTFWCRLTRRAVDSSRLDAGGIWVLEDVTARKRVEAALRQSEQRFTTLFLASPAPAGISRLDTGQLTDVNNAFLDLFGFRRDEVLGRTTTELGLWPVLEERERLLASLRQSGAAQQMEAKFRRKSGEIGDLLISAGLIELNGQRCLFGMLLDVSERKRLEARLRQSQKMEGIGHLAGGMAHEFNNLLAAMMMNLSLARTNPGAEAAELFQEVEALCAKAADLIKQLLAFSRQSAMQPQPLDLGPWVRRRAEMLRALLDEPVVVEVAVPERLPQVSADEGMLEQVLVNLCLNARDAMKGAGLLQLRLRRVEVGPEQARAHDGARPGEYVCLAVTDTGSGMDEPTMQRLFEPFFTTKEVGQGTGLGLATVRGIVQQHQGWLEVESAVGSGSTFRVYLPALIPAPVSPTVAPLASPGRGAGTILLAEDEAALRTVARRLLVRRGYTVLEASNGSEALTLWEKHRAEIDLVYTDMVMPGQVSGLEVAKRVLADRPEVKVIITSGYNSVLSDPKTAPESSIIYLPKPCPPDRLNAVIRECLQPKSSSNS